MVSAVEPGSNLVTFVTIGITLELTPNLCTNVPLLSNDGEVVRVGCDSCVDPGESISLDCTPLNSAEPDSFTYRWTAVFETETISSSSMIIVSDLGSYTCSVENPSGTGSAEATSFFACKLIAVCALHINF